MLALLAAILLAVRGGVKRVGQICSAIIPFFIVVYMAMILYILVDNASQIPALFGTIIESAFSGHAAVGAFTGSTILMALSQGVRRACYTGDIGIGYASVIHSESSVEEPGKQAALGIFGIFLDTFIVCTMTILVILMTGTWSEGYDSAEVVQRALEQYFPLMNVFMPLLIFLLGYSTMIAYFVVGIKCARFLAGEKGIIYYYFYAVIAFLVCSFVGTYQALSIMSVAGGLLLFINLLGIYLLRKEVEVKW